MPLKNPLEIPKIPKARRKKIESVINSTIAERKPDKLEYNAAFFYEFDEKTEDQFATIIIETVKEFTSFAYELSCDYMQEKNTVNILLMGLRAKPNAVPFIQPASAKIRLNNLNGEYIVNIYKQDGAVNSAVYYLNFFKKEIVKRKSFIPEKENNRHFCDFYIDEENFSFGKGNN